MSGRPPAALEAGTRAVAALAHGPDVGSKGDVASLVTNAA